MCGGDEHEGLIELGTFYLIDSDTLKKDSPKLYNIAKEWLS